MGCAAIAFELLCIFRLKIIAQLPHSFKIPSPLPRNWNPFCRISVSWPHAADAAPGTRREKDERSATEAVFGFNSLWFHAPQMNPMNKTISKGGLKCSK